MGLCGEIVAFIILHRVRKAGKYLVVHTHFILKQKRLQATGWEQLLWIQFNDVHPFQNVKKEVGWLGTWVPWQKWQ